MSGLRNKFKNIFLVIFLLLFISCSKSHPRNFFIASNSLMAIDQNAWWYIDTVGEKLKNKIAYKCAIMIDPFNIELNSTYCYWENNSLFLLRDGNSDKFFDFNYSSDLVINDFGYVKQVYISNSSIYYFLVIEKFRLVDVESDYYSCFAIDYDNGIVGTFVYEDFYKTAKNNSIKGKVPVNELKLVCESITKYLKENSAFTRGHFKPNYP